MKRIEKPVFDAYGRLAQLAIAELETTPNYTATD